MPSPQSTANGAGSNPITAQLLTELKVKLIKVKLIKSIILMYIILFLLVELAPRQI